MVKVIPARIKSGQVIPDVVLPPEAEIQQVSVLVDLRDNSSAGEGTILSKLVGILKDVDDPREEYGAYLAEKYSGANVAEQPRERL
jgi:hypothetical protein